MRAVISEGISTSINSYHNGLGEMIFIKVLFFFSLSLHPLPFLFLTNELSSVAPPQLQGQGHEAVD